MQQYDWIPWNASTTHMPENAVKVVDDTFIIRANKPGTKEFYYGKFDSKTKDAQLMKLYGSQNASNFQVNDLL